VIQGFDKFLPPKPPIVKGSLYALGFIYNHKKRFFVLNSDDGTLMRFKS